MTTSTMRHGEDRRMRRLFSVAEATGSSDDNMSHAIRDVAPASPLCTHASIAKLSTAYRPFFFAQAGPQVVIIRGIVVRLVLSEHVQ